LSLRVHTDPTILVYNLLAADPVVGKGAGVTVDLIVERKVVASTAKGGSGNIRVMVSQRRSNRFEWCTGGLVGRQHKTIRIEIVGRSVPELTGAPNARDQVDAIKQYIEQLLFTQVFLGSGWLGHTQTDAGYPSTPLGRIAYNYLQYDFYMSMGY
jgi:hypothetical protein